MKHFNNERRKIPLWERLVNERLKKPISVLIITTKEKPELDALQGFPKNLLTSDTNGHFCPIQNLALRKG